MKQFFKMKVIKIILFAFLLLSPGITNAQLGIGTSTPNPSAQLDVSSTTKGFLPPRMTGAQRDAITNPAAGLIIWCTNCGFSGELQVYNGTSWTNIGGDNGGLPSVTIGTQDWMPRNLDVTTYRNGDSIPEVKDLTQLANLKKGAWCYYDNKAANGAIYGKLYNWYAVNDPRGLAPAGWNVPSDPDWSMLSTFLGGETVAGGKIKSTSGWNANGNGTNESGFTALPGGFLDYFGTFNSIGTFGIWWASSENNNDYAGYRSVYNVSPFLNPGFVNKTNFHSLRCLREQESVTIGTQEWMQRNLNVSTYRNGDMIPEIEDSAVWETLTYGAWCYYEGNSANGFVYGKLYNWYAVTDPRGLAPAGWRIATDLDWTVLTSFLGGESEAGGKLKEHGTSHWNTTNNVSLSSNSGFFRGLPGGYRQHNGTFYSLGDVGTWWTSTEVSTTNAWYRNINNYHINVNRWDWNKWNGMSVRCIRQ